MNWQTNDAATEAPEPGSEDNPHTGVMIDPFMGDQTKAEPPTDEQIMKILELTVTSTGQLCDRLRDLFAGVDYFTQPRTPVQTLEEMQAEVYEVNVANGWFDENRSVLEGGMLMVTEVAEAAEAYRAWGLDDMTGLVSQDKALTDPVTGKVHPKPEGVGSEYADELIRLLDQCERDDVDLRAEYVRKIAYNRLRGYKHGGKKI